MADNTQVNTGSGDVIRDIDRGAGSKTQVVQLDAGGDANATEQLVSRIKPLPVQELTQLEGQSVPELLAQILSELRINNELLHAIGIGAKTLDDPARYRADPTYFAQ